MQRRKFTSAFFTVGGLWVLSARAAGISEGDAALGIRAALERGAVAAVGLLGRDGGFLNNPKVRIELPGYLRGLAMNRAAEAAVPAAKTMLVNAVKSMSVEDGKQILTGGDNSATQFFSNKTRAPLSVQFLPVVTKATEKVSLADKYNKVAGQVASLGLVGKDEANIQSYITAKALDGLYLIIGEEERKIRQDPIGTGSAILKKVFGSLR